ncbi:MAG: repeat-containing protein, partial [Acidobacteria bacterium]|nr:repeat-containing protein [Acidobacteriota bacterium]
NRDKAARESYSKAIEVDKVFVRPYLRLARLAMADEDWENAVDFTNQALELDPIAFPEAYYLNSLASFNLEDLVTAEKSARKGQRLDLDHQYPKMHLILANILSIRQDVQGSMEEMRKYLKVAPTASDAAQVRARLQEKEKVAKAESK